MMPGSRGNALVDKTRTKPHRLITEEAGAIPPLCRARLVAREKSKPLSALIERMKMTAIAALGPDQGGLAVTHVFPEANVSCMNRSSKPL